MKAPFIALVSSRLMSFMNELPLPVLPPKSPRKKVGPKFKPASILNFSLPKTTCWENLSFSIDNLDIGKTLGGSA